MFQRHFPFINFGHMCGAQEPKFTQRVDLRIVCDGKGQAPLYSATLTHSNSCSTFPYEEISIGRITINEKTSWGEVETLISRYFKRYIKHTYAYCDLGLSTDSISSWEVPAEFQRNFRDKRNRPSNKPITYFTDDYQNRIRIYLKGAAQNASMDGISFQTQIPKSAINKHVERLESGGRLILCGPRFIHNRIEIGFVAKRLAEYMLVKNGVQTGPLHLAMYNANDPDERVLCGAGLQAFIEDIHVRCENVRGAEGSEKQRYVPPPYAAIFENLQVVRRDLSTIVKELHEFRESCKEVPYVIGTFIRPSLERQLTHVYYGVY